MCERTRLQTETRQEWRHAAQIRASLATSRSFIVHNLLCENVTVTQGRIRLEQGISLGQDRLTQDKDRQNQETSAKSMFARISNAWRSALNPLVKVHVYLP